jgi:hypothetical protein
MFFSLQFTHSLENKGKSNMKLIYFKTLGVKKKKKSPKLKHNYQPKLFSKLFKICRNGYLKKVQESKIGQLPKMWIEDNNRI